MRWHGGRVDTDCMPAFLVGFVTDQNLLAAIGPIIPFILIAEIGDIDDHKLMICSVTYNRSNLLTRLKSADIHSGCPMTFILILILALVFIFIFTALSGRSGGYGTGWSVDHYSH